MCHFCCNNVNTYGKGNVYDILYIQLVFHVFNCWIKLTFNFNPCQSKSNETRAAKIEKCHKDYSLLLSVEIYRKFMTKVWCISIEKKKLSSRFRFGVVSLFNGISTFVDYLIPKPSYLVLFTNPSARAGCDTRSIFLSGV